MMVGLGVAVAVLLTGGPASAAEVKKLDFSDGSYSGVLFVYFTPPPVDGRRSHRRSA